MNSSKAQLSAVVGSALLLSACGGNSNTALDSQNGQGGQTAVQAASNQTRASVTTSAAAAASSRHLYVSPEGSDSNPGTQSAPIRSLQKATELATAGTTVHVAPGSYAGQINLKQSGTESARIYFVSDQPKAAKIVPGPEDRHSSAFGVTGSHVTISGFEVDGSKHAGGYKWRLGIIGNGSDILIENNHVHDIANLSGDCSNSGGGGIVSNSYYGGADITIADNDVHDIGPDTDGACHFIHGIYVGTSGVVSNNLIHRVGYGGIHLWHDADHVDIFNNTVFNAPKGIIVGTGERYRLSNPGDYVNVTNNILVDNEYAIVESSDGAGHGAHNQFTGNVYFRNRINENLYAEGKKNSSGNVVTDPRFVDYRIDGSGNYALQSGSPVVGKGAVR